MRTLRFSIVSLSFSIAACSFFNCTLYFSQYFMLKFHHISSFISKIYFPFAPLLPILFLQCLFVYFLCHFLDSWMAFSNWNRSPSNWYFLFKLFLAFFTVSPSQLLILNSNYGPVHVFILGHSSFSLELIQIQNLPLQIPHVHYCFPVSFPQSFIVTCTCASVFFVATQAVRAESSYRYRLQYK